MKKILSIILFQVLFSMYAQDLSSPIPVDQEVKIGVLDNGLKYYIRHNAYPEKKVELRLGINAGSVLEKENQRGLAHFLEHMNFNGTKHFPKNKLIDYLQSIGVEFGADLNAYTSFNKTVYMLPIPLENPDNLENGLLVLEDWAFNALLDTKDIDEERGIILEEKRLRGGASQRMLEQWLPIAYKDSRYANRLPIGTEKVLTTFQPETLRDFHKDWYRPDLMTVAIVGDIDVEDIEKRIKAHFGSYKNPANAPKREYFSIPNYTTPNIAIASDKEATGTSAQIEYFNPKEEKPMSSVGDYKKSLMNNLFSIMINNRYQELANSDNPPFNYAYSFYGGTFSDSKKAFTSVVSSTPEKLSSAFEAMLLANQRVKQHGFVATELERAKADMLSRIEKQYNNRDKIKSSNWVGQYLNNYLDGEPIPSIQWEKDMYNSLLPTINLKDVNGLIDTFIQKENYSVIITSPEKTVSEQDVKSLIAKANSAQLEPYLDGAAGLVLMKDKPKAGKIKSSKNGDLETTELTLNNGVKVVYKKTQHKNDEVLFKAFSYGGYSLISDEQWKKVHFAMGGITEAGINGLSKTDLDKVLAGKSVRVSPFVSNESEGMNGNSTNKDLETLFQLIHLYFTQLNFNQNAFDSYKQKQEGLYGSLINNPQYYFFNELNKKENKNNPRKTNIFPLEKDFAEMDYKLAYEVYQERFANPADFTFFFVGSIDEAQFKEYVETYLGSLKTSKSRENYKEVPYAALTGERTLEVKKGDDPTKAMVIVAYETRAPYNKEDAMGMKIIGDALNIKLTEVLREQEGGVYSTNSNGGMDRGVNSSASLSIVIPTNLEQYMNMEQLAIGELDKIKKNGPTPEDLNKVKETLINDYKENIQTNNYWLNTLYSSYYYHEDPKQALEYENLIKGFSVQSIQSVAKKYIKDSRLVATLIPDATMPAQSEMKESGDVKPLSIIDQYLLAVTQSKDLKGAKAKLQKVKSLTYKGKADLGGMSVPAEMSYESPNIQSMTLDLSAVGQGVMKVYASESENYVEANGQKQELPKDASLQWVKGVFPQAFYGAEDLTMKGIEKVGADSYYVVENSKRKITEYYDTSSGLLMRNAEDKGDTVYSNYKEVNGFLIPFLIEIKGQMPLKITVESVEIK